jgi:hypothetical protein
MDQTNSRIFPIYSLGLSSFTLKTGTLDMTDSNVPMVSLSDALHGKVVVVDTSSLLMAGS